MCGFEASICAQSVHFAQFSPDRPDFSDRSPLSKHFASFPPQKNGRRCLRAGTVVDGCSLPWSRFWVFRCLASGNGKALGVFRWFHLIISRIVVWGPSQRLARAFEMVQPLGASTSCERPEWVFGMAPSFGTGCGATFGAISRHERLAQHCRSA